MTARAAGLEYPQEPPPAGAPAPVCPGVSWLRMDLPFDLNHINLWLLEDGGDRVLVDCGADTARTRGRWRDTTLPLLAGTPPRRIVVSHFHPDHVGLAGWLARQLGATVHLSAATRELTELLVSGAADGHAAGERFCTEHGIAQRDEYIDFCTGVQYRALVGALPERTMTLGAGEVLRVGGQRWRVLEMDGHAHGLIGLHEPQLGVLIGSDQVLPEISANVSVYFFQPQHEDPLGAYLDSLERLLELPGDTLVLPSHGPVFRGLHQRVRQLQDHHQALLKRLLEALREPACAAELTRRLFNREVTGLHGILAFGETLAHLRYLERRGRVRGRKQDGVRRFAAGRGALRNGPRRGSRRRA